MITILEDSRVAASAERIWEFLVQLDPVRYKAWHPVDHLDFRRQTEAVDDVGIGQRVYFKERIGKRVFRFSCVVVRSVPGTYVEFAPTGLARALRLGRGFFTLTPVGDQAMVEAVVELGWDLPGIGAMLDRLARVVLDVDALRRHMSEEAEFLEIYLASTPN